MDVLRQAIVFLNPGQTPVVAMDAPLYALAKYVQWNWPETHGEDKYLVMFGGLHIALALWKTFGDYLEGSGWTAALTQAGVASSGTADSFLNCSHITRTRQAHQISTLALAKLQEDAFSRTGQPHTEEAKETWRQEMINKSPTFQYWDTVLRIELLVLIFIRAHRERNFQLYVESMKALAPWFFALDHYNYARWIPVHIRDMESLPLSILEEFKQNGQWVISKTTNRFSAIPVDQAHEQNNGMVKGAGGALGLTENPSAFRKWMLAGPKQARLLKEFEVDIFTQENENHLHHEEGLSTQKNFKQDALKLAQTITEMGNPFLNDSPELLTLDTCDVLNESVVSTVRTIEALGKQQFEDYMKAVVLDRTRSIHEQIKKNSLPLFGSSARKVKTKQSDKITTLKTDVDLFSRLYIVAQNREMDLDTFFMHENNPCPPSISDRGKLRQGTKSDLLTCLMKTIETESQSVNDRQDLDDDDIEACLQRVAETEDSESCPSIKVLEVQPDIVAALEKSTSETQPPSTFDVKVLDGAAVVHFLSTSGITTFEEYADVVFLPYLRIQLESAQRLDVVWDEYTKSSIKESTREKRGKGTRRKVQSQNKIPAKWHLFLRD